MPWPFTRKPGEPHVPETPEIPLFPLNSVLFPDGRVALKVFEQRYLDMVSACLHEQAPFGFCLIAEGHETGEPAVPHAVGTLAEIVSCDMPQLGILMLLLRGGRRFRIREKRLARGGLLQARVELFAEALATAIPDAQRGLVDLLRRVVADLGVQRMPLPHRFDDAEWVGCRLAEILPIQLLAKQKLLELEDPVSRLEIIFAYLAQRGLVR